MTLPLGITRSLGPTFSGTSPLSKPFLSSLVLLDLSFASQTTPDRSLRSDCHPYSLTSICPYTLLWITVQMNLSYAHLRYLFEGYRPSQTNNVTQSSYPFRGRCKWYPVSEWYFTCVRFRTPTYSTQKSRHTQCNDSVKVYGVFSSTSRLTVSSLLLQFH